MNQPPLFRPEVLTAVQNKHYGRPFINTPVNYTILTIGCSTLVVALIAFILFAECSEKFTVKGYINTTQGIAHAYPSRPGVVIKSYVTQGSHVKRGAPLFLIDTSYDGRDAEHSKAMRAPLEKRKQALQKELASKQTYLRTLKPLLQQKYLTTADYQTKKDEILALQNQQHLLEMERIRYQKNRTYLVRAPMEGIISSVMIHPGQHTQPAKPLLSLLPEHTTWVAELYIPVAKSGFINPEDTVLVHYDAYPYQRFGSATGHIQRISQTILTDAEEDKPIQLDLPYYKAIAVLDKQSIQAYGKSHPIQHGMTLTAVILGPKKKLWQWILDPLYSYTAEVAA